MCLGGGSGSVAWGLRVEGGEGGFYCFGGQDAGIDLGVGIAAVRAAEEGGPVYRVIGEYPITVLWGGVEGGGGARGWTPSEPGA